MSYSGSTIKDLDVTRPDGSSEYVSIVDDAIREVKRAVVNDKKVVTVHSNYTASATDRIIICIGTLQITLPRQITVSSTTVFKEYIIINNGSGAVTVAPTSPDTVPVSSVPAGSSITLIGNGGSAWIEKKTFGSSGGGGSTSETYGSQLFTSNGTFTVPLGVRTVYVSMAGGGGGGGGGGNIEISFGGGGGGGAHAVLNERVSVTPGQTITVTIGAGGVGGQLGTNGESGGTSSFGTFITCPGGGGGTYDGGGGAAGGLGGARGSGSGHYLVGYGGGSIFGSGGIGHGARGGGYGAGGSGGVHANGVGSKVGGNGSQGFCLVTW